MTSPLDGLYLPVLSFAGTAWPKSVSGEWVRQGWIRSGLLETWVPRGIDHTVPSAHGRVPGSRKRDYLRIEVDGFVVGHGGSGLASTQRANMVTELFALRTLLDPTQAPADLVVSLDDGDIATISCRPVNVIWNPDYPDPGYRPYSAEFEAVEDDWVRSTP